MDAIRVSDKDAADPQMMRLHLNRIYEQTFALLQRAELAEAAMRSGTGTVGGLTDKERSILRSIAIGSTENPISSQTSVVPTVTAFPPVNASTGGQLVRLASDGVLYIFDASSKSWVDILAAAPANMVTTDTNQAISGIKTFSTRQVFTGGLDAAASVHVTAGGIDVDAGGVNIDAGGLSIGAGGANVQGGSTFNDRLTLGADLVLSGASVIGIGDSPFTVPADVLTVLVNTSGGAITINLTATPASDRVLIIVDGTGSGAANNITVNGNGVNINGAASTTITTAYGGVGLLCTSPNWVILWSR